MNDASKRIRNPWLLTEVPQSSVYVDVIPDTTGRGLVAVTE